MLSKELKNGIIFSALISLMTCIILFSFDEQVARVDCLYQGSGAASEIAESSIRSLLEIEEKQPINYIKSESKEGGVDYYFSIAEKAFKANVVDEKCVMEIERVN
ncbi:hypothetical protein [Comamonas sp. JNW]|uniref:hypothetical protein n=1 Tax=Comamonas sp. JNW TaxID=2170731 RepID=UPI001057D1BE|nr:hypothetical protein [Comamonas sp. JNW]